MTTNLLMISLVSMLVSFLAEGAQSTPDLARSARMGFGEESCDSDLYFATRPPCAAVKQSAMAAKWWSEIGKSYVRTVVIRIGGEK